ncbi:aminotransferase class V-fold PLP-dependent enzyme [Veronia nyctiphanis]|uniref:hypothetical protein n=1 Tax=Veronia nyctiphanis TaxID=1278244 RepID=UPI00191C1A7B|nr:hypothetical protein [Veronia nyctiphanis]
MGRDASVAPYALASHSLKYFNSVSIDPIVAHNGALIDHLIGLLGNNVISPHARDKRSGTAIVKVMTGSDLVGKMKEKNIWVDERRVGLRVSPHLYNSKDNIEEFSATYLALL